MYNPIMRQFHEEQRSLTPSELRIRCPYCFQVFKTFKHELAEDMPDFQCSVCHEKFCINSKDTSEVILGTPGDMQKGVYSSPVSGLGVTTKICPRCTEEVPIGDQECTYCGVVFIKIIEGVESSFQLRGMWGKVVKNWHNEKMHDDFLINCHKQNELVYGISCYGRILKEDKDNKKAKEMIKRMESLTWFFEEEMSLPKLTFKKMLLKAKDWCNSYAFDALILAVALCFLVYVFA